MGKIKWMEVAVIETNGIPIGPPPEAAEGERVLLMAGRGREWRATIPANAKVTFGPFSPGHGTGTGTVRVYGKTKEDVIAVFSGVEGFYDSSRVTLTDVTPEVKDMVEGVAPVSPDDIPY